MTSKRKSQSRGQSQQTKPRPNIQRQRMQKVEEEPAAEWGERIATGKIIAGSGKKRDDTPGASEQK